MIIDAHAHIYEYLKPYGAQGEGRAIGKGKVRWPDGRENKFFPECYGDTGFYPEVILRLMDDAGVDMAVLLQAPNYGFHNDYVAETVRAYPERFVGACTFDPFAREAIRLFRHFTEVNHFHILKFEISESWGLAGFHPNLSLSDPMFDPIWEHAQQTRTTVVIDTGVRNTKSWKLYPVARIRQRFPELRFVIAHALFPCDDGFNDMRLAMLSEIADGDVFFDIANIIYDGDPYPYRGYQKFVRELCNHVGADHIIWGTDLPGTLLSRSYHEMLNHLSDGGYFSAEELKYILGDTAAYAYRISLEECPSTK